MKRKTLNILGLMSGTSLDGIDGALIQTNGVTIQSLGPGMTIPYDEPFRDKLRAHLGNPFPDSSLTHEITLRHQEFVEIFLATHKCSLDLIGFHGQTIYHVPPKTVQLGDGESLYDLVQIPVVYDFRTKDCENGGQGAPLVPIYHQALWESQEDNMITNVAFLNLGGVGNITILPSYSQEDVMPLAFDTGPGNALIDDFMREIFSRSYDYNGLMASEGTPDLAVLERWLNEPYFSRPAPKSLDRNTFLAFGEEIRHLHPNVTGLATLTAFSAFAVVQGLHHHGFHGGVLILCGGGRKNQTLVGWLKRLLPQTLILLSEEMGWDGDMMEAHAFGFLAARALYGLPYSFPSTTGVSFSCCGGKVIGLENLKEFL